jgi:ferrous iron transport protein B
MNELLNMISDVASGKYVCKPYRIKSSSKELNTAIEKLSNEIEKEFSGLPNLRWVALRLLEGDQSIMDAIRNGDLGNLKRQELASIENE